MIDSSPENNKSNISEVSNLHDEYQPLLSSSLNSSQNEKQQPFMFHQFLNDQQTTNNNNNNKKQSVEKKNYFKLLETNKIDKLRLKLKRKCHPSQKIPTNSIALKTPINKELIYKYQIKQSKFRFFKNLIELKIEKYCWNSMKNKMLWIHLKLDSIH